MKNASAHWNPALLQNPAFVSALQKEVSSRAGDLLKGISRYQSAPHSRPEETATILWQQGNARLLDYGAPRKDAPIVFFIPSLINRYYILDLSPQRSMIAYLQGKGYHPLVMDWQNPGMAEKHFACEDYITRYLAGALTAIKQRYTAPVVLAGYCMGGVFSLALAQFSRQQVNGLILLATPWDFHAPDVSRIALKDAELTQFEQWIAKSDRLPSAVIQTLFYMTNPLIFPQKFRHLASLPADSPLAQEFIELEQWVNDGVDMTHAAARDVLVDWVQRNMLANGTWKVDGKIIAPASFDMPTLIAAPRDDKIVPSGCSLPLSDIISSAMLIQPSSGHVSMVVGSNAERELWQPTALWLKAHFG